MSHKIRPQHSSNFRSPMIQSTIAVLEMTRERLMESLSRDTDKQLLDCLFGSANLFAQEVETLQREVDRLKSFSV